MVCGPLPSAVLSASSSPSSPFKENSNQSEEGQETEACWQVEQQIYQPVFPHCTQERTYHIKAGEFSNTRL